jgi:hypothetical protein
MLGKMPQPMQRALILSRSSAKSFTSVEVTHPEVSIKVFLLQKTPTLPEPIYPRETNVGNNKFSTPSFSLNFGLPSDPEHAFLGHSELARRDVQGVVISERCKHHAQPPPNKQTSCLRLHLVHYKEL